HHERLGGGLSVSDAKANAGGSGVLFDRLVRNAGESGRGIGRIVREGAAQIQNNEGVKRGQSVFIFEMPKNAINGGHIGQGERQGNGFSNEFSGYDRSAHVILSVAD